MTDFGESLLKTQQELNNLLPSKPTLENLKIALLDELGEVTHLIKPTWAWWKRYGKDFPQIDNEKLAEELSDILHFALTMCLMFHISEDSLKSALTTQIENPLENILEAIISTNCFLLISSIVSYSQTLGVDLPTLLDAYYKKVIENKARFTTH